MLLKTLPCRKPKVRVTFESLFTLGLKTQRGAKEGEKQCNILERVLQENVQRMRSWLPTSTEHLTDDYQCERELWCRVKKVVNWWNILVGRRTLRWCWCTALVHSWTFPRDASLKFPSSHSFYLLPSISLVPSSLSNRNFYISEEVWYTFDFLVRLIHVLPNYARQSAESTILEVSLEFNTL